MNEKKQVFYFRGDKSCGMRGIQQLLSSDPDACNTHGYDGRKNGYIYYINSNHDVDYTSDNDQLADLLYKFGTELQLPIPIERGDILVYNRDTEYYAVVLNPNNGENYYIPLFTINDGIIELRHCLTTAEWHLANREEMVDFLATLKNIGEATKTRDKTIWKKVKETLKRIKKTLKGK